PAGEHPDAPAVLADADQVAQHALASQQLPGPAITPRPEPCLSHATIMPFAAGTGRRWATSRTGTTITAAIRVRRGARAPPPGCVRAVRGCAVRRGLRRSTRRSRLALATGGWA